MVLYFQFLFIQETLHFSHPALHFFWTATSSVISSVEKVWPILFSFPNIVSILIFLMVSLFVCIAYINFSRGFFLSFWFCSTLQLLLEKIFCGYIKFKSLPFFLMPQYVPSRIMTRNRVSCGILLPDYRIKRAWSACIKGVLPYVALFLLSLGGGMKMGGLR